jgi:hypothetical protein
MGTALQYERVASQASPEGMAVTGRTKPWA